MAQNADRRIRGENFVVRIFYYVFSQYPAFLQLVFVASVIISYWAKIYTSNYW